MAAAKTSIGKRLWTKLREQRTGVVCALTSALLLALGSVLMDRYPERYRGLGMDDLRFFLDPPSFNHVWLYALAVTLAVWALSALVCTIDSLALRFRRRILRPSAYGAPLLHLTFIFGLLAHLWGGLTAESRALQVGPQGFDVDGAHYTPRRLLREDHPNGQPRSITVVLERARDGQRDEVELGYNRPLVFEGGAREILLGRIASGRQGPVLLLTDRRNPSMPLVWVTALLAVLGVLLVAWERARSRREAVDAASATSDAPSEHADGR